MVWYCSWLLFGHKLCPKPLPLEGKCASLIEMHAIAVSSDTIYKAAKSLIACHDSQKLPEFTPSITDLKTVMARPNLIGRRESIKPALDEAMRSLRSLIATAAEKELYRHNGKCVTVRELHAFALILSAQSLTLDCQDWVSSMMAVFDAPTVPQLASAMDQLAASQLSGKCDNLRDDFIYVMNSLK